MTKHHEGPQDGNRTIEGGRHLHKLVRVLIVDGLLVQVRVLFRTRTGVFSAVHVFSTRWSVRPVFETLCT